MSDDQQRSPEEGLADIGRRRLLVAIAATTTPAIVSGEAAGQQPTTDGTTRPTAAMTRPTTHTSQRPVQEGIQIDPTFGFAGTANDVIPDSIDPDHTVGLHVDEEKFIVENGVPVGVEFGAFHFDPVGLHVETGDVVNFRFDTPEHSVTSFHTDMGRQQRVPGDVPWFSSPVGGAGGFWLYKFETPGVYDLFCAPHELFGMAMRIVVGDQTAPVIRGPGRPPIGLTAPLVGTGIPDQSGVPDIGVDELDPATVVQEGTVHNQEIPLPLSMPIGQPEPIAGPVPEHLQFADRDGDGSISRQEAGQSIAAFNNGDEIDGHSPTRSEIGQLISHFNQ